MLKISIIQRNKSQQSKVWYLRIFDPETKAITYKSLGTTKKGVALELLEKENQRRLLSKDERKLQELDRLGILVERWLAFQERQNKALTARYSTGRIRALLDFCEMNQIIAFADFSPKCAFDLLNGLNVRASTLKTYKAIFKSFFNWVIETYDLNTKNVFTKAKTPKVQKPIRDFWTLEQIREILSNTYESEMRLCFAFMAFAGLRINEAVMLKWENIKGDKLEILDGKGGKNALLPMAKDLQDEIERHKARAGENLSGRIFESVGKDRIYSTLKRVCGKLGFGKAHPHKFRHSFASNLLRAGANIVAVSRLMRHSSPTITLNTYSHILPDDLGQTLELLGEKNT